MKKKPFKHMTKESFDQVKILAGANLKIRQIAQIAGVSTGTVCIINKVATFPEYKAYVTKMNIDRKAKKEGTTTQLKIEKEKPSETPIYDVLVEIRDLVSDTNRLIALSGKSKGFKLF